eukprot:768784-Hanusia_phi.AAC.6
MFSQLQDMIFKFPSMHFPKFPAMHFPKFSAKDFAGGQDFIQARHQVSRRALLQSESQAVGQKLRAQVSGCI